MELNGVDASSSRMPVFESVVLPSVSARSEEAHSLVGRGIGASFEKPTWGFPVGELSLGQADRSSGEGPRPVAKEEEKEGGSESRPVMGAVGENTPRQAGEVCPRDVGQLSHALHQMHVAEAPRSGQPMRVASPEADEGSEDRETRGKQEDARQARASRTVSPSTSTSSTTSRTSRTSTASTTGLEKIQKELGQRRVPRRRPPLSSVSNGEASVRTETTQQWQGTRHRQRGPERGGKREKWGDRHRHRNRRVLGVIEVLAGKRPLLGRVPERGRESAWSGKSANSFTLAR